MWDPETATVQLDERWQVRMHAGVRAPLRAPEIWQSLKDFRRFACIDLFHREVHLEQNVPRRGVGFRLEHRFFVVSLQRIGKILYWREGVGYAFSDLSRRGRGVGFPHMYAFQILPEGDESCIVLRIHGRWTARFLPRALVLLWLHWVFAHIQINLRREVLRMLDGRAAQAALPVTLHGGAAGNPDPSEQSDPAKKD